MSLIPYRVLIRLGNVGYPIVGVLGCMAERLKTSLLEEESVDFVCGPDAYRDIPLLVDIATSTGKFSGSTRSGMQCVKPVVLRVMLILVCTITLCVQTRRLLMCSYR